MKLLLDIGNSNIKWGWSDNGRLSHFGQCGHSEGELARQLEHLASQPEQIWIAGVAGARTDQAALLLGGHFGIEPRRVAVQRNAFGIQVGYRHPERLGVDRWLALVAVRDGCAGPAVVADAGTALTVDLLADDGIHLGGVICPGISMMRAAVLGHTAEVARYASDPGDDLSLFSTDTAQALASGSAYAAAGLIERAADELESHCGEPPAVFLTGGCAGIIAPLLQPAAHVLRELVLRGLAMVAAGVE